MCKDLPVFIFMTKNQFDKKNQHAPYINTWQNTALNTSYLAQVIYKHHF